MKAAKKKAAPKKAVAKKAAPKKPAPAKSRALAKRLVVPALPARKRASKAKSDLDTVSWWDDFYRVVRQIPRGRVTTYGAVAAFGGHPRAARHVGYAMAALKDTGKNRDVPWQRVLGAAPRNRAKVTIKDPIGGAMQRALLEAEGVRFDALGRIDLGAFGWTGPGQRNRAKSSARLVTPRRR
jgi:methylated-DNA-protein-cysteine methyltransferase-like protein